MDERTKWDARYAEPGYRMSLKPFWNTIVDLLPTSGHAIDLACGEGQAAVFLAKRGLRVTGVDVSTVGLTKGATLAREAGVAAEWVAMDLRDWSATDAALVSCTHFLDRDLIPRIRHAVAPGGLVALEMLTVEGSHGSRYRVDVGETLRWFVDWRVLFYRETGDGLAQLVARK